MLSFKINRGFMFTFWLNFLLLSYKALKIIGIVVVSFVLCDPDLSDFDGSVCIY